MATPADVIRELAALHETSAARIARAPIPGLTPGYSANHGLAFTEDGRVRYVGPAPSGGHTAWIYRGSNQSIPDDSSYHTIIFDSDWFIDGTAFSYDNTTGIITVNIDCDLLIMTHAVFEPNTTGVRVLSGPLIEFDARNATTGGYSTPLAGIGMQRVVANDTIYVEVLQTSGGNLNLSGSITNIFLAAQ